MSPAPAASSASRRAWPRRLAVILAGLAAGVVVAAEVLHWRASRQELGGGAGRAAATGGVEAVVVLGFRNRGERANWVNRWRVRAGIRSFDPAANRRLLVLCGGPVGGPVPEAELMAAYARERGYDGPIACDATSTTTWENLENAVALIEGAATIKVVSNSLHAAKGRRHLWQLRPELAERLARGGDYRFGEQWWLKPIAVVIDVRYTLRGGATSWRCPARAAR